MSQDMTGSGASSPSEGSTARDTVADTDTAGHDPAVDRDRILEGRVLGDYRLLSPIKKGGMGQVWVAEQLTVGRRVALKLLKDGRAFAERDVALLAREARAGGRLSHPSIVAVYDFGEVDGIPYIAQELVGDGFSLADAIEDARREPVAPEDWYRRMAEFFAAAAEAMQVAHDAGVIHRDLKPGNILVTEDDRPKIADFGLAKVSGTESFLLTGIFAGSRPYMSPEQAMAKRIEIDHRTDIFSLGVTLYEALTLQRPFGGDTAPQITEAILFVDPPEPRKVRSRMPRDLSVITMKCLEKRREQRYATMGELAADLRRFLRSEPIVARPPGPVDRALKWTRRHPTLASVLGLGGAALVAITALAIVAQRNAEEAQRNADTAEARRVEVEDQRALTEEQRLEAVANAERAEANAAEARAEAERADRNAEEAAANARQAEENARRAEAQAEEARREKTNVLRLSAFRELEALQAEADVLWPATPDRLPEYDAWLARADRLLAGLHPSPDGDAGHLRQLEIVRERGQAIDIDATARDAARAAHPRWPEWDRLQRVITWMVNVRAVLLGEQPPPDVAAAEEAAKTLAAAGTTAWELVDCHRSERGREVEGLYLARLDVEQAGEEANLSDLHDTLALALLACGLADEANEAALRALELASDGEKEHYRGRVQHIADHVASFESDDWADHIEHQLHPQQTSLLAEIDAEITRDTRTYTFADDDDAWWYDQLERLIASLTDFADPTTGLLNGLSEAHGWGVRRRCAFAAEVEERTVTGEAARARWDAAIASIADREACPAYDGLLLSPQLGLLPIGRDPASGLWEFWHVQSGAEPLRDDDGRLVLDEAMGVVLVLIPGGTFHRGAQKTDPALPNYDPQADGDESPVREVTLSPYLLSKYELTQGQWERLTGGNPSFYGPHAWNPSWSRTGADASRLHPVEQVTWWQSMTALERLDLQLPSETQWEYASRAGTSTVFWTGDAITSLQGAANLADRFAHEIQTHWTSWQDELEDDHVMHAPVGSYRPNAYGLHDTHGNVWEWCLDAYENWFYRTSGTQDPVNVDPGARGRVFRGGSFSFTAVDARSAYRNGNTPDSRNNGLGLRPARAITP